MAEFTMNMPDDFLKDLLEMDPKEFAEEALKGAVPDLEAEMKRELQKVIEHDGDSELVNSMRANKPYERRDGGFAISVTPHGNSKLKTYYTKNKRGVHTTRKKNVSNALKTIWKEYGIPGHQPARPFIATATKNAEENVLKKLQEAYERKIK